MEFKPIGYLVRGGKVLCGTCEETNRPRRSSDVPEAIPLYLVNVLPYRQNCAHCRKVLCEGHTSLWCELFDSSLF